jgi:hypothetical protein
MMSAIASGWNVIVRKKTLEGNRYDLRKVQVYPGFRSVKYPENELWTMGKKITIGTRNYLIWME